MKGDPGAKFAGHGVLRAVRRALGRKRTSDVPPPTPPELPEPIIRLVHTEFGLAALFAERAKASGIHVHFISAEAAAETIVGRVQQLGVTSLLFPPAPLLTNLGILPALIGAGITLLAWDETTLDAAFDAGASLTDAWAAIAETGSVVVQASPTHGRAVTLLPRYHFVVLDAKVIVPDLVDLLDKISKAPTSSATTIISGPSKNLAAPGNPAAVDHGPRHLEVWILK